MMYEQAYRCIGVLVSLAFLAVGLFLGLATLIQLFQSQINTPIETILAGLSSIAAVLVTRGALTTLSSVLTEPVPPPES